MKLPFTEGEFLRRLRALQPLGLAPIQVVLWLLAAAAAVLALFPRRHSDRAVAAILALLWLWMGLGWSGTAGRG